MEHPRDASPADEQTEKLLANIEESQLGFRHNLQGPHGPRRVVYTDYTASGKSLSFIEDYIRSQVLPTYANTHTNATLTGRQTTQFREEARQLIKQALNCGVEDVVIFAGSGCTGAVHKLLSCLCLHQLPQPPVVFVSPFEHHANLLPWREAGAEVVWVAEDGSGRTDIVDLEHKLQHYSGSGRQLIGSLNAASNITGVLTDTLSFSALLHKYGALSLWDYASAAPYIKMDMNPMVLSADKDLVYKDAIFFSVHKFVGGPETPGVLVAKKKLFHNSSTFPSVPAGGTVSFVTPTTQHYWQDIEVREEGGTPQIIGSIRAGLAVQLKEKVGSQCIEAIELACTEKVLERWNGIPELYVTGPHAVPKLPVFSFIIRHEDSGRFLHHNYVCSILNDVFGIQSRGGCMCAGPYAQIILGIDEPLAQSYIMEGSSYSDEMREALKPGVTRVAFPYFMNEEAQEFVIEAVKMTAREGWKLLPQYKFKPESGTFHSRHLDVSKHQRKISDISYSNGEMTYPTAAENSSAPSFREVLEEAQQLFDGAAEPSSAHSSQLAQEYSSLLLLGREMEEMRWFLLPYEAHLFLSGCPLPHVQVPFEPRDYESDNWRDIEYLNEWDKHWNPSFWEDVKDERLAAKAAKAPQTNSLCQWTIHPAINSPDHKRDEKPDKTPRYRPQGNLIGTKKGSVSMSCLYTSRMNAADPIGSTGSLVLSSHGSSGYSSGEGDREDREAGKTGKSGRRRGWRKGRRGKKTNSTEPQLHTNKCVVM